MSFASSGINGRPAAILQNPRNYDRQLFQLNALRSAMVYKRAGICVEVRNAKSRRNTRLIRRRAFDEVNPAQEYDKLRADLTPWPEELREEMETLVGPLGFTAASGHRLSSWPAWCQVVERGDLSLEAPQACTLHKQLGIPPSVHLDSTQR